MNGNKTAVIGFMTKNLVESAHRKKTAALSKFYPSYHTQNKQVTDMINNHKEQERQKFHRTIWWIANDLRGSVDGWDFKQYVLGMLFYRYISENLTNYINQNEREAGDDFFDYYAIL